MRTNFEVVKVGRVICRVLVRERMLDMTELDDGLPVIGEIPKYSDTLVCKWRVV